jgi:hypothetical protein
MPWLRGTPGPRHPQSLEQNPPLKPIKGKKMSYAKDWGDVFNKATVAFTKEIHGYKAKKDTLAPFMTEQLEPIQRPLALLTALAALDKISLAGGNAKEQAALPANIKLFEAALKKLDTAVKAYVKATDAVLKLTPSVKNEKSLMLTPTPIKDLMPESYRQLKLLKTEAPVLYERAANALAMAKNAGKLDAINKAKEKAMDKAGNDDDKRSAVNADVAMQKFLVVFAPAFKSALAKGAHGIQKIKAEPTPQVWNANISIARDISQNLNNIVKLKADAKHKTSTLGKKLPDPGHLARDILPYCNGALMNLAGTTTEAVVKGHLKDFTALYKTITTTYKDVIDGKLK